MLAKIITCNTCDFFGVNGDNFAQFKIFFNFQITEGVNGPLLGEFSDKSNIPYLIGRQFVIRFISKDSGSARGFKITWKRKSSFVSLLIQYNYSKLHIFVCKNRKTPL